MYRTDLAFLAIFLGAGGAILWLTRFFPDTGERFGPAFLPRVLAVLLLALTAVLLAEWLRAAQQRRLRRARAPLGFLPRAAVCVAALAGYTAVLGLPTPLGFPGWTALFLFGTGLLFGGRSPGGMAAMAIGSSLALYLFFRVWLHVPLPASAWF